MTGETYRQLKRECDKHSDQPPKEFFDEYMDRLVNQDGARHRTTYDIGMELARLAWQTAKGNVELGKIT